MRDYEVPAHGGGALLASGCIWSPANRTEAENTQAVNLSGYTNDTTRPIVLKARNYDTGDLDTIANVLPTTRDDFGQGWFAWNTSLPTWMLPRRYRAPSIVGGSPAGRLEISGFVNGTQMLTFTESRETCVVNEMVAGTSQMQAAIDCSDGNQEIFFDNNGLGLGAEPIMYSAESRNAVGDVRVDVWSYLSQTNRVYALICAPPAGSGVHPIAIYNHGGGLGTTESDANLCVYWAQHGWVFAMSSYRAETLRVPAAWNLSKTSWNSDGTVVETSLGEVNDTMRLLAIAGARSDVDPSHALMFGGSHGGAFTTRAVQRGARVAAAVASFPATDWTQTYDDCAALAASSPTSANGQLCSFADAALRAATGGSPHDSFLRASYDWRSPAFFAGDLAARGDVKLLLQQGTIDPVVHVDQTCRFAGLAGFPSSTMWHVPSSTTAGASTTAPVSGCGQSWLGTPRPTTGVGAWPANRYFLVYDDVSHNYEKNLLTDFASFVNSLGWTGSPF